MNKIFILFLSLSFSGSIITLVVFFLKFLLKNKVSKIWHYYIWIIVMINFILQVNIYPDFTNNLFNSLNDTSNFINLDINSISEMIDNNNYEKYEREYNLLEDLKDNIGIFWFFICFFIFTKKAANYRSFLNFIKAGSFKFYENSIYDIVCDEMNIKIKPQVYINKLVVSPILVGIFKQSIILPDSDFSQKELYYIYKHELTHYKRMDIFYKWIVQVILCIHWYNPLVYLMVKNINKYCELSCDEMIIKNIDADSKKDYGDTLISTLKDGNGYSQKIVSITLNENIELLKERLSCIMRFNKKTKMQTIISIFLSFFIFVIAAISSCVTYAQKNDFFDTVTVFDEKDKSKITYINKVYFENSYIISLGWNLDYSSYTQNEGVKIIFDKKADSYKNDKVLLNTVAKIIDDNKNTIIKGKEVPAIGTVIVNNVEGPFTESADELARKFYDENIVNFSAVISKASLSVKNELIDKALSKNSIVRISILADEISEQKANEILNKALLERNSAIISIFSDRVSDEKAKEILNTTLEKNDVMIASIFSDKINEKKTNEIIEKEADEIIDKLISKGDIAMISIFSDKVSEKKAIKILNEAIEKGDVAVANIFSDEVDEKEADEIIDKLISKGDIAMISIFSDKISGKKAVKILNEAIEKGDVAVASIFSDEVSEKEADEIIDKLISKGDIAMISVFSDKVSEKKAIKILNKAIEKGDVAVASIFSNR